MQVEFVGRTRELAELLAGLDGAFRGEGSVFVLAGEPGIGKTTLAERVAGHAAEQGGRVVWSRSWDGGGTAPYWTWAQVVRTLADDLDDDVLRACVSRETAHVTLLAPALADRYRDVASSMLELDSDAGRFYLFDATARFLKQVSAAIPLVLVLDDVLAGDRPSLQLLRFLARDVRSSRILVLATYRDTDASQSADTVEVLSDIVREGHVLDLHPLTLDEVGRLIADVAAIQPQQGTVAAIHEATGGNPLFVREVTRLLATGRSLDLPRPTVPVPDSVRAVIRRRMAPLSADAIQILSAAAVVGRDFDIGLVAAACDFPTDRVLTAFADAADLGFVTQVAETVGTYRFSHPLMREAIYEGLPIAVRVQMHQRVGFALERLHGTDAASPIGELAYHFARAAPIGESARAGEYARRAGDRAMSAFAYEDAVMQYRRALDALTVSGESDPGLRCELLLRLGRAQARAGDYPEAKKTFLLAADAARDLGDADKFALAALGYGEPQVEGGLVDRQLIATLEEALQGLTPGDSAIRARIMARLSLELTFSDEVSHRESLSLEAIEMARRLSDVVALCYALRSRWLARWGPDGLEERTALAEEHLVLARETGDREIELLARARRITCAVEAGDGDTAAVDVAAHAALAEELRMPYYAWVAATMRAGRALLAGRLDAVEPLADQALRTLKGRPNAGHAHLNHLTMLRWEQGRLGEMRGAWQELTERFPQLAFARAWLCLVAAEDGRREAASAGLRELVGAIPDLPRDGIWLPAVIISALTAARLEDPDAAARLYPVLHPYAGRVVVLPMPHPVVCYGAAALYLGLLATIARDWDAAERHLEAAGQTHRRLGARPLLARTYAEHASMLLQRGHAGDRDRAAGLLDRAATIANAAGMTQLQTRMATLQPAAATVAASASTATDVEPPSASAAPDGNPTATAPRHLFRREGEYWTVMHEGSVVRLRDTKGLRCLARLLASPGRELAAVELEAWDGLPVAADGSGPASSFEPEGGGPRQDLGDAGALLDPQAKAEYRERIGELRAELDEAEAFNDPHRADRARQELEFLTQELARAVGLAGRDRRAASHAERARLNVSRAIRAAMRTLAEDHPPLADHLSVTIRTGRFCSYTPDPRAPIHWET